MVDPVSLSLGVIAANLVAQAAERATEKTADAVVDASGTALQRVVGWVRSRFGGRTELVKVEEVPDSGRLKEQLGAVIDAELVDDEAARSQLQALVDAVQEHQPRVFQNAVGHHIVQGSNSTINVNWGAPESGPARG